MKDKKIVLLAGEWDTTPIVYNFLKDDFKVVQVIMEDPVPRKVFLKKRIKKLGFINVAGQVLFSLLIAKPMTKTSGSRISQIKEQYKLKTTAIPKRILHKVNSVNDTTTIELLRTIQPDLIIVHGTRIISKKVLAANTCSFLNIHAGITPRYRGSYGAYWALANNDAAHCGVTVHLVDAGIDTGNILAQVAIPYTKKDNFVTYPYLQLPEGLIALKEVIKKMEVKERPVIKNNLDSALWHHPTLWGYLWKRLTKGVK